MDIFSELNENKNLSLALGYFDGVHKGHQCVIKSAVSYARKNSLKSAVITFKDHPCCYFWDVKPRYILTRQDRRKQMEALGIDYLYELNFEDFVNIKADKYIEDILVKYFLPSAISTGFNHNFGSDKSGDTELLEKFAGLFGYKLFISDPIKFDGEIISSTKIRNLLAKGEIIKSNNMLGYNFRISGDVIEGKKLGRKLGYRTANVVYPEELVDIPFGVYETNVFIGDKKFKAITNYGIKPTVSTSNESITESHIIDFNSYIYGENITIEFVDLIRKEQKFNNLEELKRQIQRDIASII